MTTKRHATIPIPAELVDDIRMSNRVTAAISQVMRKSLALTAENIERKANGLPELVRHGPPTPRKAWEFTHSDSLDTLDHAALLAEAKRLHAALADIAGDGTDSEDYYVGDTVTLACEAIGRRITVPGLSNA